MTKATHGGAGRGQGRKPMPDEERTIVVTVRLTPARRDKLRRLGASWLAKAVDRAREPDATLTPELTGDPQLYRGASGWTTG